jgi:glycosyltransferase involved in cell wall biosynthesis
MTSIIGKVKQIARKLQGRILDRAQYKDEHLRMSIISLGLFDSKWYLEVNPDVKKNQIDPLSHYLKNGWREGRTPFSSYDETTYLQIAPDFNPDQTNPLLDIAKRLSLGTIGHEDISLLKEHNDGVFFHGKHTFSDGITICGFLRSEIGLGQAARNIAYSADASRLNANFHSLAVPGRDNDQEFTSKCNSWISHEQSLFVLPLEPSALNLLKKAPGRHLILYPYWELIRIPESCMEPLSWCDEFWAPSSFIQEMLDPLDKPITLIPQPVKIPLESEINPLPADSDLFTVLTYFDIDSYHARKNPMASVKAFQAAFPKEVDVRLIVKLRGSNSKQEIRKKLRIAAQGDPRIVIIDKTISRTEIERLILGCNAFISLQRSEGFGFGPAEALASGKPVITTCYGGVTDFIHNDTAYPVGFDLVSVKRGEYPEWKNQVWADPFIADAVDALRFIRNNPNCAAAKGRAGRAWMIKYHSIEAVGKLIKEKLGDGIDN